MKAKKTRVVHALVSEEEYRYLRDEAIRRETTIERFAGVLLFLGRRALDHNLMNIPRPDLNVDNSLD